MRSLSHDVRLALRRLRLAPGFTLFAVASLALGIGTTTVVYSVVRTGLWQPLGVPDAPHLMAIRAGTRTTAMSWPDFLEFQHEQRSFRVVAASLPLHLAIGAGPASATVLGEAVSGDYFAVAGVGPALGRLLEAPDVERGAPVAVISDSFWKASFKGDRSVIGRSVKVGGEPFQIVGVVQGAFHGMQAVLGESVWVPVTSIPGDAIGFSLPSAWMERPSAVFQVWGRLKPGRHADQANADVASIGRALEASFPTPDPHRAVPRTWQVQANASALPDSAARDTLVFMILTCIATVLLIACSNLANLALAKETSRAQETAVRSALGASRWRLIREQLVESGIVVITGGLLGLALALAIVRYEAVDIPIQPGIATHFPQFDASLFAAALVGMAAALAVFGLWPAVQSSKTNIRTRLGAGAHVTMPKWRVHRTIIAWQVCGSVALLLVSLLTVRVVTKTGGLTTKSRVYGDIALAEVDFALNGDAEPRMRALTSAILDRARAATTSGQVAAANGLPFGWLMFRGVEFSRATVPGSTLERSRTGVKPVAVIAVTSSYFGTTGTALLRGQILSDQADAASGPVAVVNEATARQLFRSIDVVGKTVNLLPPPTGARSAPVATRIVGVCANDQPWLTSGEVESAIFVPFAQRYVPHAPITFLARTARLSADVSALRASIARADPDLALSIAGGGTVLIDGPLFPIRLLVGMTAGLGGLALVLAMAGLFGVLSHLVSKRTREIGVRLALGARRVDIVRMILRDGLRPVAKGLVLGLFIGAAGRVAIKTFVITDVSAFDVLPILLLPIPFAVAALMACWIPAARASRVEPTVALRDL